MDKNEKVKEIMQFVMDHPESQASRAVGRRMIGTGESLRDAEHLSQLGAVLAQADDEEVDACYYIIS
ncbi:hypothetical protein [Thermincola ferriacetica]